MAFLSKIGRIFSQTSTHVTGSSSMLQSIRCMSSSKVFVGGDYDSNSVVRESTLFICSVSLRLFVSNLSMLLQVSPTALMSLA